MSEETPVVDCHLCKDLEFARNLATQMKEGYGRHNSNRSFRDNPSMRYTGMVRYAGVDLAHGPDQMAYAWMENQQARVIGRLGDHAMRERWQDCEIGDAVPESKMQGAEFANGTHGVRFIEFRIQPRESSIFERVCTRMRSADGIWRDEYLWKRIS